MPPFVKLNFATPWIGSLHIALIALAIATAPVFAHHGASAFDPSKEITIDGTVTNFVFSNPHVQVFFQTINNQGVTEAWQGELPAPNTLIRAGWSKRTLKPGDPVTIIGFPAWKGQRVLWIRKIVGALGQPLPLGGD